MLMHLSTTNFWTLVVGLALAAANVIASSRLAPHVARLFRAGASGHRARGPESTR
jgi:hypothetical protein